MKERGMLFSAPMMRANMAGTKTQTRRIMKPQPEPNGTWNKARGDFDCLIDEYPPSAMIWCGGCLGGDVGVNCSPYGCVGDRIWARETHSRAGCKENCGHLGCHTIYRSDESKALGAYGAVKWTPAIHMPRWASRFTATIMQVRAQRLQDISDADAAAEGVEALDSEDHCEREEFDHALCGNCGGRRLYDALGPNMGVMPDTDCRDCDTHVKRYRWLWESINGEGSWEANPWVWAITYKLVVA